MVKMTFSLAGASANAEKDATKAAPATNMASAREKECCMENPQRK
jgi:hypothetical protein